MKLVAFNLEEALANPERVVCVTEEVKLVKWQYFEDIHKEGFEFPIAIWFDINGAKAYSASNVKGVCIRGVDYNLMLKAQKKTIRFNEALLCKEGVRVVHKYSSDEYKVVGKSWSIENTYVIEAGNPSSCFFVAQHINELKRIAVMEVDE